MDTVTICYHGIHGHGRSSVLSDAGFSKAAGDECLRGLRGQGFQPWFLKIWDP